MSLENESSSSVYNESSKRINDFFRKLVDRLERETESWKRLLFSVCVFFVILESRFLITEF